MKNILLTLILSLISTYSLANEEEPSLDIYLGGWSYHVDAEFDYNESHNMVAIEYENIVFGSFKNSFDEDTYLLGYHWYKDVDDFRIGGMGLLTHGYSKGRYYEAFYKKGSGQKVLPIPVVYVSYTKYPVQPVIGIMGNAITALVKIDF